MNEVPQQGWLFPTEPPARAFPDPLDTALARLARTTQEGRRVFGWSRPIGDAMRDEYDHCQRLANKLDGHKRAAVNAILKSPEYENISLLGLLTDVTSW